MFPDDYVLGSGRTAKAMFENPSPELGSDCFSQRDTPDVYSPEEPDFQLVKYVKLNMPSGGDYIPDGNTTEGGQSVRQAISCEFPPDSETLTLQKILSSRPRRQNRRSNSFEISASVNTSHVLADSDVDDTMMWKTKKTHQPKQSRDMKRINSQEGRQLESPFGAKWYPERYSPCARSNASSEDLTEQKQQDDDDGDDDDHQQFSEPYTQITYRKMVSGRNYGTENIEMDKHRENRKISDIEKIVRKQPYRSSPDRSTKRVLDHAAKAKNSSNKSANAAIHDLYHHESNIKRQGIALSPLPTAEQILDKKFSSMRFRTDSESACSESVIESGYSDMLACPPDVVDKWMRAAEQNPCSQYDELQPRFAWLKRSVAPFTALAGAILVSVASM